MKVTRLGPIRPIMSLTGILSGSVGPSGQVLVSNGSNGVAWGSNIETVWVNGTTQVIGPAINFADGSNTTVSASSNTIRVHATASGGSFGSNSNQVGTANAPGASTDSSRADHVHRGVHLVSSNGSNSLYGDVGLQAGTGIALGVAGQTITVTNTGVSGPAGGGGGLTQAYVGYNTIGGTWETLTNLRVYAKKVTLASACELTSISVYIRNAASLPDDEVHAIAGGLYTDSAGTPALLIESVRTPNQAVLLDAAAGAGGDDTGRWMHLPMGAWLAAGDYWLAFQQVLGANQSMQIAYDATGTDRYYTSGGAWLSDWGWYSPTTSSNAYSIRANTIR